MADFSIRPARADDYDDIGSITVDAYVSDGFIPAGHAYTTHLADAAGRADAATLLVAVDGEGTTLGSVTFCRAGSALAELSLPGEAEFRMLAVTPSARGRGVGEALVRACLQLARKHGDRAMVLSTQAEMTSAHRIYGRLGFTRLPERDWRPVP
ncbi:MAG: GNAT family N-acetyltransferase, partial [Jiangellaceae bacterium]